MVAALWCDGVEVEFDIDGIGGQEVVVVVGMGKHMKVLKAMAPLLGSLCGGWVAKEQSEVDKANGKDGFGSFYVLAVVDKCGEGLV